MIRIALLATALAVLPGTALAAWPAPWSVNAVEPVTPGAAVVEKPAPLPPFRQTSLPKIFLLGAVRGYQVGISPADGASCSMYPTCSGYAMLSLRKHGPVTGFVMTSERVMRNHGGEQYPPIEKFDRWRLHDPVEANDYWFPGVRRRLLADLAAHGDAALSQRRAAGLRDDAAPEAAAPVAAPAPAPATASADLGFAESLFQEGDFYRSITEAKRFLFVHPADPRRGDARLLIGRAYLAGEQWKAAIAALEPFVAEGGEGKVAADAAFALADARLGAKEWDVAALEYSRFEEDHATDPRASISDLRVGWSRIFAADEVARLDHDRGARGFRAAAKELQRLPPDHPEVARAKELAAGAESLAELPRRSPAVAGTLSAILPGAGQVYAGRGKDGFIAFVVNALFIGGAIESYRRENYVASGVLVLFEMGWYSGNIYSAINSAHRFNDERRATKLRDLRKRLWVHAVPVRDGALASVGGSF